MKYNSVHSCRFVHQAKFHCIMTTLNRLFKSEFERGETGKEARNDLTQAQIQDFLEMEEMVRFF